VHTQAYTQLFNGHFPGLSEEDTGPHNVSKKTVGNCRHRILCRWEVLPEDSSICRFTHILL